MEPNPPIRDIETSQNQEQSQLTQLTYASVAASGYTSGSPPLSFGNHEGGFSDEQGSMEEGEEEKYGGDDDEPYEPSEQGLENDDMDDQYNEHFTEASYGYPFDERIKYFLAGNLISKGNRQAVELCILAEAGMTVSQNSSAKQKELMEQICSKYGEIIRTLDPALWSSSDLRHRMYERLDGGRKDGFGERDMWKKWQKLKSHMKK